MVVSLVSIGEPRTRCVSTNRRVETTRRQLERGCWARRRAGAVDASDVDMSSLSSSPTSAGSGVTSDAPHAVGIGGAAMMVPFAIVLAGLLLSGSHTPSQLEMTLVLLAVPLIILALRRRQRAGT